MDQFIQLLRESTIIQGVLTVGVVGVWLYLVIAGHAVPEQVNTIVGLVVGFYFGTKSIIALNASRKL